MSVPAPMEIALREELKSIDRVMDTLTAKKEAIKSLLAAYEPEESETSDEKAAVAQQLMNSMDMSRVVIRNAGRPLKPDKIRTDIKRTYGIEAPKTLQDMLWKKARKGDSGFFKDEEGNIGLTEMLARVETVHTIHRDVA